MSPAAAASVIMTSLESYRFSKLQTYRVCDVQGVLVALPFLLTISAPPSVPIPGFAVVHFLHTFTPYPVYSQEVGEELVAWKCTSRMTSVHHDSLQLIPNFIHYKLTEFVTLANAPLAYLQCGRSTIALRRGEFAHKLMLRWQ